MRSVLPSALALSMAAMAGPQPVPAAGPTGQAPLLAGQPSGTAPTSQPSAKPLAEEQIEAARKAGVEPAIELDLGSGLTMKMVLVPQGTFLMGSPASETDREEDETQHEVTITKPFYMGIHEVTRGQFARFIQETNYKTDAERIGTGYAWTGKTWDKIQGVSWKTPGYEQADDHPATEVTWNDAVAFCEWLGRKVGATVRLPTEAEWEYACRAGTTTAYHWGDDPDGGRGWCNWADAEAKAKWRCAWGVAWSDGHAFTAPAGSFRPNAWGLYDMHGNAWEWCSDFFYEYGGKRTTDPTGPSTGTLRVMRGGSWSYVAKGCRSANRLVVVPAFRLDDYGFRCARTVGAPTLTPPSP